MNDHEELSGSRARRVLVASSELPPGPGGIGTHAHSVAVELARQGREVAVVGCQHYASADELARLNESNDVSIKTFSDGPDPVRTATQRPR